MNVLHHACSRLASPLRKKTFASAIVSLQCHGFSDRSVKAGVTNASEKKLASRLRARMPQGSSSDIISSSKKILGRNHWHSENLLSTLHTAIFPGQSMSKELAGNSESAKVKQKKKKKKNKTKLYSNAEAVSAPQVDFASPSLGDPAKNANGVFLRLPVSAWFENRHTPELELPSSFDDQDKDTAPHIPRTLLYTRRIEGIIQPLNRSVLEDLDPPSPQQPIAKLGHGLDRILFNPGVSWLQDPRSRVYNFTTWLESIPSVKDFAFERLGGFISSSRDQDLWSLAKREGRTFAGSTSSLTGLLSQIYFLISGDKGVNTTCLSKHFQFEPTTFTSGQRMPASIVLKHNDGVYAIDSDSLIPGSAEKNVLTWMGTLLEKFLTTSPEKFSRLLRSSDDPLEPEDSPTREAYRYSKSAKFVMRSQLDCHDSRLPGTGVFDIKTRAAVPIRLDLMNYEENSGYLIRTLQGPLESFEKEYYDLIRSAFLKYSFQARIGNMDGVFVAYHNTARIFGFQYIPLSEMDERIFGQEGRGDRVFEKCVGMLENILDEAIHHFPNQSIRCIAEKVECKDSLMIFLEPVDWDETVQGPVHIVQLDVVVVNYAGDLEVRGSTAISHVELPWTILWSISTSSLSQREIRANLSEVRERQFRAYNLPTGVSLKEMEKRWEDMQYNLAASSDAGPQFDPVYWQEAGANVQSLRGLARAGRKDSMREAREGWEAGGKKKVWGVPEELWTGFEEVVDKGSLDGGVKAMPIAEVVTDGGLGGVGAESSSSSPFGPAIFSEAHADDVLNRAMETMEFVQDQRAAKSRTMKSNEREALDFMHSQVEAVPDKEEATEMSTSLTEEGQARMAEVASSSLVAELPLQATSSDDMSGTLVVLTDNAADSAVAADASMDARECSSSTPASSPSSMTDSPSLVAELPLQATSSDDMSGTLVVPSDNAADSAVAADASMDAKEGSSSDAGLIAFPSTSEPPVVDSAVAADASLDAREGTSSMPTSSLSEASRLYDESLALASDSPAVSSADVATENPSTAPETSMDASTSTTAQHNDASGR
ncbi:hypothetical protein EW146_g1928 [Bondarzewia mesenterica]|uniref:Pet127-domain-containing protein n=1 Tax=Bondarzewia mesenterica TaxID=1095465 RepID=A0A4S4M2E8_9AGAM|nr:hypothetical protein EW146_g1928 [Bondarzewia mesenterica]